MKLDRLYPLSHSPIYFYFKQTPANFVVTEIPLYDFAGEGEHLILKIRKKGLSTWQMIDILSNHLGVKTRDIGYAGLKDKDAMTIQYISLHKRHEDRLDCFSHEKIKILEKVYHKNKLRIGHLKGNRFLIRLKKVNPTDAKKIESVLEWIKKNGIPNYFGYQRFGRDGDNFKTALEVIEGKIRIRDRKKRDFLISAYQSHLFNLWLSKRVEISRIFDAIEPKELNKLFIWGNSIIKNIAKEPHFFKLIPGDLASHYPYGKLFIVNDINIESKRFCEKKIVSTGPIVGERDIFSKGLAYDIEKEFIENIPAQGGRRYAWVWPEKLEGRYIEKDAHFQLSFSLPKGSYATVLLEMLANRDINQACF